MARKRIHPDVSTKVLSMPIEKAEEMIVIEEKSPIWHTKKLGGHAAFVTLKPPPDVSEQVINELKARLYADHGARVVHVHAQQKSIVVVEHEIPTSTDIRAVVVEMVEQANTRDRPALSKRMEQVLAKVGL